MWDARNWSDDLPARVVCASREKRELSNLVSRSPLAVLPADGSTSTTSELSSEGEEEESVGQEDEDDGEESTDEDEDEDEEERAQRGRVQALWSKLCEQRDLVKQLQLELSSKSGKEE